ncbi:hypothetical protein GYB22_04215 [bacterium]|nr:hypothetical protein [bacterium]
MKKLILILLFSGFFASSCDTDNPYTGECFIPEVSVNAVVNLSLPEYFKLQNIGEFVFLEGGNRGIFLIHNYDDRYYALERTCPYQSDEECAKIQVDSTSLFLKCGTLADTGFVECCASKYQFDGTVFEGPSRCNLKFYQISTQGSNLYISN